MTRRKGSRLEQAARTRAELAALAPQVTHRQLEYWVEKGWIVPDGPQVQGHPRTFSDSEKRVLAVMARLAQAGIPAVLASQIARRAVTAAARGGRAVIALDADLSLLLEIRDI